MPRELYLEIVTAERLVYSGPVSFINAPGSEGRLGILPGHAALLASLRPGELRLQPRNGEGEIPMAIGGGFLEVSGNRAIILARSAERSGEIDIERALQARSRAVERLHKRGPGVDLDRARSALERAEARLRVAQGHEHVT